MAGERHGRGMGTACYVWIGLNKPQSLWFSYVCFRVKESGDTDVVYSHFGMLWTEVWHSVVSFYSSTLGEMKISLLVSSNGLDGEMTQNESCHRHDNPLWYFSFPLDGFSWNLSIFFKSVKVSVKSDKGPIYIFITSRSIVLRMKDVSDKFCRENQITFYVRYIFFLIVPFAI